MDYHYSEYIVSCGATVEGKCHDTLQAIYFETKTPNKPKYLMGWSFKTDNRIQLEEFVKFEHRKSSKEDFKIDQCEKKKD